MKRRILLVEDDTETIDLMRKELEFLGHEVAVARIGEERGIGRCQRRPDHLTA
jgi:CheY-like chemotaxis protein